MEGPVYEGGGNGLVGTGLGLVGTGGVVGSNLLAGQPTAGPQKQALLRQHRLAEIANAMSEREAGLWEGTAALKEVV